MLHLGFPLAALIGLSLGLLGGGGSILTVPILVYVLGFAPKESIAMGLAVVGTTSLFGAVGHWRKGNVRLKPALLFAAVAMVGTYGGARLATFFSGTAQLVLFAGVMLVAAVFMYRSSRRDVGTAPSETNETRASSIIVALAALGVGALTGIAGVGGGFLIVPALVLLIGLPMKQAVGTSLVVIALNSFVGFAGYLGQVEVPWSYLATFTAIAVVGITVGTRASHHVSAARLKQGFSAFLVVMGLFIVAKNRAAFSVSPDPTLPTAAAPLARPD